MTDTERITERWTCMGRRLMRGDKVYYAWLEPGGETYHYAKVRGRPGRTYDASVARTDENVTVYGEPQYVETLPADDPRLVAWEAEERTALTRLERIRIQRNDEREHRLDELAAPLRELYRKQVGPDRRAAFLAALTELVTR